MSKDGKNGKRRPEPWLNPKEDECTETEQVKEKTITESGVNYGSYNIKGLGPDAETVVGENGGKQSHNPYAWSDVPPLALARVATVFSGGRDKYGKWNWTKLKNVDDHVDKAIGHIYAYIAGDTQEGEPSEHLAHAVCRLLFALDVIEREKQDNDKN